MTPIDFAKYINGEVHGECPLLRNIVALTMAYIHIIQNVFFLKYFIKPQFSDELLTEYQEKRARASLLCVSTADCTLDQVL